MERATEYQPTRASHPVESLVEFLAMYPGIPINEPFWRKLIDDYVASVVVPPVSGQLPFERFPDTEADGIVFCGKCGKQK